MANANGKQIDLYRSRLTAHSDQGRCGRVCKKREIFQPILPEDIVHLWSQSEKRAKKERNGQ